MHTVCFRYLCEDAEQLAGPVILIDAGRRRGTDIANSQGMHTNNIAVEEYQARLDAILGEHGTRLCVVHSIHKRDDGYEVHASNCADEKYTLGVFIGLLDAMTGKNLHGKTETTHAEGDYTFVLAEI
jgi:hypothetical protein